MLIDDVQLIFKKAHVDLWCQYGCISYRYEWISPEIGNIRLDYDRYGNDPRGYMLDGSRDHICKVCYYAKQHAFVYGDGYDYLVFVCQNSEGLKHNYLPIRKSFHKWLQQQVVQTDEYQEWAKPPKKMNLRLERLKTYLYR